MWRLSKSVSVCIFAVVLQSLLCSMLFAYDRALVDKICDAPQDLTGAIPFGSNGTRQWGMTMVWDGSAYAIAYESFYSDPTTTDILFIRMAADGRIVTGPIVVTDAAEDQKVGDMAWTGSEYAIIWEDLRDGDAIEDIWFARMDSSGNKISGSERAIVQNPRANIEPRLAWNGSGFGMVYGYDDPVNSIDIYFNRLGPTGVPLGPPLQLSSDPTIDIGPQIIWNGSEYAVVYTAFTMVLSKVVFHRIDSSGVLAGGSLMLPEAVPDNGLYPTIGWDGSYYHLVYNNFSAGNFSRVIISGSGDLFVEDTMSLPYDDLQSFPELVWTGAEFGLLYYETDSSTIANYRFALLSPEWLSGVTAEIALELTPPLYYYFPAEMISPYTRGAHHLAFGTVGYGMCYGFNASFFKSIGCHDDTERPVCPQGLSASNIDYTSVDLSWQSTYSPGTELAHYDVYRNNELICQTTSLSWTDEGLSPDTAYVYTVRATDAAARQSVGCDTLEVVTPEPPGTEKVRLGSEVVISSGGNWTYQAATVWDGSAYGVSWSSDASGNGDIWFARMAADGTILAGPEQITSDLDQQDSPEIAWNGSEYGLVWRDYRSGTAYEIWFARVALDGSLPAAVVPVTSDGYDLPGSVWSGMVLITGCPGTISGQAITMFILSGWILMVLLLEPPFKSPSMAIRRIRPASSGMAVNLPLSGVIAETSGVQDMISTLLVLPQLVPTSPAVRYS